MKKAIEAVNATSLETCFARLQREGTPLALATVIQAISPTSGKPGDKALVSAEGIVEGWIGGGCAQHAVIDAAGTALESGECSVIRVGPKGEWQTLDGVVDFSSNCFSGGTLVIFVEPIVKRPVLLVLGESPLARALTALACRVGFYVIAAFPGANEETFPDADYVLDGLADGDALGTAPGFVVVATQGKRDEPSLEFALATGAHHIAFVASQRKWDKLRQYLKERGHDQDRLDAVVAPAGVEIGAVTPEEIALSVLAGVVKARRAGTGNAPDVRRSVVPDGGRGDIHHPLDPVCGMPVDPQTAELQCEHLGKTYYFCCAYCKHSFEKDPSSYLSEAKQAG